MMYGAYHKTKTIIDQAVARFSQKRNDVFLVAWRPVGKGNLLVEMPHIIMV